MQRKSIRPERLASLIQAEVMRLILFELRDPEIQAVTVTRSTVTHDLRHAALQYSLLDPSQQQAAQRALERATPYFRRALGQVLTLRHTPDLKFAFDKGLEHSRQIHDILGKMEIKDDDGNDTAE